MQYLLLKDLPRYECLLEAAKEFPDLDPTACEVFLNLLRTGDDVFGLMETNFTNHHLSQGRFSVLMLLWNPRKRDSGEASDDCGCRASHRTPADLAEAAGVTRATMTGLIDTLERDGLVRREVDPADRRMQLVSLTAKGESLLREILPSHFQLMASIMASLSVSERRNLVKLLNKISRQTEAIPSSAAPETPAVASRAPGA